MGNVMTSTEAIIFISNKTLVICSKLSNGIITTGLKQIIETAHKQETNE